MFGGLRSAEILNLKWSNVDFRRGKIRVNTPSKKDGKRTVQMSPNLAEFLLPLRGNPKEFVVPHGQRSLQRWARKLFNELKIKMILHGARHSFTRFHLALHPIDETMQELGYADGATLFKYCRGPLDNRKKQAKKYFSIAPLDQEKIISLEAA